MPYGYLPKKYIDAALSIWMLLEFVVVRSITVCLIPNNVMLTHLLYQQLVVIDAHLVCSL